MITMDRFQRNEALRLAVDLHAADHEFRLIPGVDAGRSFDDAERIVLHTAETFLVWLIGPTAIRLRTGQITDQTTGRPSGTAPSSGGKMQLHDNEQFDLSADTKDAKGFETADVLTWTVDDADVVSLVVSDDTKTCTVLAGNPGSAVITVTDGTLSATEAVDVITGDTTAIVLGEGAVTTQP